MSGSTVPQAPPPPGKSDLAVDVDQTIRLFCEKTGGVTEQLPFGLSVSAAKEVKGFCANITRQADRYTGDLQLVAISRWDLVSTETKKELAQLASKVASGYQAPSEDGYQIPMPDVADFVKGKGKQYKLGIPVKFASHTDVKILINFDQDSLLKLHPNFLGGGAEFMQPLSWGNVGGGVFVDVPRGVPDYGWFIKVDIKMP